LSGLKIRTGVSNMPLVTLDSGKKFESHSSSSLLDAAEKAGIALPYSCKTGRCSTCKCKVISGQSVATVDELGLTSEEKAQGFILSCVRSAQTDMLIEVEDLGDQVIPEVKTLPARISSLEKLAPDVLSAKLRFPPSTLFTFLAGQYIDVIGPGGIRRSYSVANAPASDNQLELHVRAVQSGAMSQYWFDQAKVNDLLRINGPLGSFFTRPLIGLHLVFLATGTGIAPVKAMLEQLASAPAMNQPFSVTVYWGGREPQDLYANPSEWHPTLRYVPVLSRAPDAWAGKRGYIQKALLSDTSDLSNTVVYACGSDAMIQSAKAALTQAGLPHKRFYSDAFVPSGM
jgi:CDP-4-dehydro-6-deoxyglucose reductase, E3